MLSLLSYGNFFLQLANHFCNSIGILQQAAQPSLFTGFEKEGMSTHRVDTSIQYLHQEKSDFKMFVIATQQCALGSLTVQLTPKDYICHHSIVFIRK